VNSVNFLGILVIFVTSGFWGRSGLVGACPVVAQQAAGPTRHDLGLSEPFSDIGPGT
jgi:hypothetical protein